MEKMLPAIWGMPSDLFIFEQDSAPAHRAKGTIALLRCETPSFIGLELWPANSPDLNSVDYMQNLRSNTGTRLPGSNTGHRRVEGAPHRCFGKIETNYHLKTY